MRRKLTIALIVTFALLVTVNAVVFAEYYFTRSVTDTAVDLANIELGSYNYLDYTSYDSDGNMEYTVNDDGTYEAVRTSTPTTISTASITGYASYKDSHLSDPDEYSYLNQYGYQFSFTNTIMVYARVQVRNSWISHRIYNTGRVENVTIVSSAELFDNVGSEWKYDVTTGYIYYRTAIAASETENTLTFDIDSSYYYESDSTATSYREYVMAELSFNVDIIQANRAEARWGISNIREFLAD